MRASLVLLAAACAMTTMMMMTTGVSALGVSIDVDLNLTGQDWIDKSLDVLNGRRDLNMDWTFKDLIPSRYPDEARYGFMAALVVFAVVAFMVLTCCVRCVCGRRAVYSNY